MGNTGFMLRTTTLEAEALWALLQHGLAEVEALGGESLEEAYGWPRAREQAIERAVRKFAAALEEARR